MKKREDYNRYMRVYVLARYRRRRASAIQQLGGACAVCGSKLLLEIDHINKKDKSFNIAAALSSWSEKRVQAELKKCQLLCHKHHQVKSLAEAGKQQAQCGTLSGYRYCKCERCRAAKRNWDKEYKRKRRGTVLNRVVA